MTRRVSAALAALAGFALLTSPRAAGAADPPGDPLARGSP